MHIILGKSITDAVSKSITKYDTLYCIVFMCGFEQYAGTQHVLILRCCMYLFCGIACGTEATGGGHTKNLTQTICYRGTKSHRKLNRVGIVGHLTAVGNIQKHVHCGLCYMIFTSWFVIIFIYLETSLYFRWCNIANIFCFVCCNTQLMSEVGGWLAFPQSMSLLFDGHTLGWGPIHVAVKSVHPGSLAPVLWLLPSTGGADVGESD